MVEPRTPSDTLALEAAARFRHKRSDEGQGTPGLMEPFRGV